MQPTPPCPAPARWWPTKASGLLLCWQFWLGVILLLLFLWVMLPSEIPKLPTSHLWEGFLRFGNFSFTTPSPGWVSVPNSHVSLFVFYILSYLLSKRMGCLSGCLVSSASIQKFFCGNCSAFKRILDEFVGEKVVSLSYSPAIGTEPFSSIFAWRIPWTEESSGLQSIGLQRVGHNWSDLACPHTCVICYLDFIFYFFHSFKTRLIWFMLLNLLLTILYCLNWNTFFLILIMLKSD